MCPFSLGIGSDSDLTQASAPEQCRPLIGYS